MTDIVWDLGQPASIELLQNLHAMSPDELAERIGIRAIRCATLRSAQGQACARQFVDDAVERWRDHERQTGHGSALWSFGSAGEA